jgi:Phage integrase family
MSRPRDRASASGLLPRMEARPRRDGLVTYRYHPSGGKPISLGTDKIAAIRKVLDLLGDNSDRGTIGELWRLYQESTYWTRLAPATQTDYTQCSAPLLKVFSDAQPRQLRPADIARYLRKERADAPVRANREFALLSNLLNLAVERGELDANPCKQVRRNREAPRNDAPEAEQLVEFLAWARERGGQALVLAGQAEFAALAGSRRIEFLDLHWPQVGADVVRLARAKQRGRETVDVVAISPALATLLDRMRALSKDGGRLGPVFPNRDGNAHSERGFKTAWSRLMVAALVAGVVTKRFTFHDLRAYHVTQHKLQRGALPDLHSNPATTARVYDRTKEVKRRAL